MTLINRRNFTKTTLLGGGIFLFPGCAIKSDNRLFLFFNDKEVKTIVALCNQIIPADDDFGGATDAEVVYYIDRQLNSFFKYDSSLYRQSVLKLQSFCLEKFNKTFRDLDSDKQISVMRMMENNKLDKVKWKNSSLFFNKIRLHTMQGFYGSPIHGGNKNFLSFDILNIDGLLRQRLESPKK